MDYKNKSILVVSGVPIPISTEIGVILTSSSIAGNIEYTDGEGNTKRIKGQKAVSIQLSGSTTGEGGKFLKWALPLLEAIAGLTPELWTIQSNPKSILKATFDLARTTCSFYDKDGFATCLLFQLTDFSVNYTKDSTEFEMSLTLNNANAVDVINKTPKVKVS